jgi:hypothetical protein
MNSQMRTASLRQFWTHARSFAVPLRVLALRLVFLIGVSLMIVPAAAPARKQEKPAWDGNQTTPVHLIPLKDEFDQPIIPTEAYPLPFSSRYTCAPCHEYEVIRQGLHFKETASLNPGRPGEPWVWVDEKTGTCLPLSQHGWPGMWNPSEVGLSAWEFTLLFGRHMAGGGVSEPDEKEITPDSRWEVSGKVEINCLGCHGASTAQSLSEWTRQIMRQNFRWAATAASGLGEVNGMASRLAGTWDIFDGPNPDDTEWAVAPSVKYESTLFDSKHRLSFNLVYKPGDERCLACHSVTPIDVEKFAFDGDAHAAAGLKCASCHRNGISHTMIRGYEGEAADNPILDSDDFTCAGCHLGNEKAEGQKALAGRLGAPFPEHRGLPAVHFKRLSCTVCHSGPWPGEEVTRVRTSRANRLGIYGIARWSTDLPAIFEPVYVRDQHGKLTPHRLMWPAFWAKRRNTAILPLRPEQVLAAAGDILSPDQGVVNILAALTLELEPDETAVLVLQDRVYEVNADGGLNASAYPGELPAHEPLWAIRRDNQILPLIPEFDPAAEELDQDTQAMLQKILGALAGSKGAPGKPVLVYQDVLYQVVESYLEKSKNPGEAAAAPRLAWLVSKKIEPLVPEFQLRTIAQVTGLEQTLTEEQVALVLEALMNADRNSRQDPASDYVYISGGKMFEAGKNGKLSARDSAAAGPVAWPMAHQVRPARQSLGVNGCTDCHRLGSRFLFRKTRATGPLKTTQVQVLSANSFMELSRSYQMLFGFSFAVRPLFKWALFLSVIVIGSIFLLVLLLGLGRFTGLIEKRK